MALREAVERRLHASWSRAEPDALARALSPLATLHGWLQRRAAAAAPLPESLPLPVVVVGNWIVGGAGKTPWTMALVDALRERGFTPGVVSRGHGRDASGTRLLGVGAGIAGHVATRPGAARETGDEPLLIHLRTGAPVAVDADRPAAVRALAAARPDLDVVIADDGLQHRRLARDAELWVFDDRGFGNGLLLPAGPLRGRPTRLPERARVVYSSPQLSTPWPGPTATRRLGAIRSLADWWQRNDRDDPPPSGAPVTAACGLARPAPFFQMLRERGIGPLVERPLADHADWAQLPWEGDPVVIVTEKDAVKLDPTRPGLGQCRVATLDSTPDARWPACVDDVAALLRRNRTT